MIPLDLPTTPKAMEAAIHGYRQFFAHLHFVLIPLEEGGVLRRFLIEHGYPLELIEHLYELNSWNPKRIETQSAEPSI